MLSVQKADDKEAEEEEEKTVWRTEGSDYIGKRVRRYVFDARGKLHDAADGVVVGWLSTEESDYLAEESGEPAPLWHMTYDDTRIGGEDLEEHEVQEAMDLVEQPLPDKVQAKYQKRLDIIALQKIKKKEKEEKQKAKEDAKMLRALQQMEKDEQKKERERTRLEKEAAKALEGGGDKDVKEEEKKDKEPTVDEADVLIVSGKYKGIRSRNVPVPAGSKDVFPSAELSDDFISIYTFLHDLSAPLGAEKMQFQDVLDCLAPPANDDDAKRDSDESFLEVAKFLTDLASRSLWIRDSDEEVMEEVRNRDVCDIALAPGPLLSATANDATVKYSCWQLCNETSWPEIARILLQRRTEVIKEAPLVELCDSLATIEPGQLSVEQKVKLLRFLCDEASAGDRVHRVMEDKFNQISRILDKKRTEDLALKSQGGAGKKGAAKSKGAAGVEKDAGDGAEGHDASGVVAETGAEGEGEKERGGQGRPAGSRTAMELMLAITDKDATATFEIKHKGNITTGSIDKSGIVSRIVSNGQDYDTPKHWIVAATGVEKHQAKAMIMYKGEALRSVEKTFEFPPDAGRKGGSAQKERSEMDALMGEFRDESLLNIDTERRKREIQTALKRARRGIRYQPVGYDRWHRSYWCFEGIGDRIWVHSPAGLMQQAATAQASSGALVKKGIVVPGCWQSSTDFGYGGQASEEYKKLGVQAHIGADWAVYHKNDGTLQALIEVLSSGPNGKREAVLLAALREHGMLDDLSVDEKGGKASSSSPTDPQKDASSAAVGDDVEMKDGHARSLRAKSEDGDKEQEEGYEWNELPSIGDLAWARLGEGHKRTWYPVVITDPPTAAVPEEDDAQTESDDDGDGDAEWQSSGSEYLQQRLLVEVPGRRGETQLVPGRISGWLPKELADFTSDVTKEAAALWRVKFQDKKLRAQDLEEFEVKEGIVRWMREESKKKSEASQVLSRRSMFGQTITKVDTRLFNDDESIEILGLNDLQPYLPFKEQHEQEMRRAGKTRVLQQVMLANQYLDEHGSAGSADRERDLAELMRKLGIANRSENDLSADMKASTKHCAHFPRILNVVQENRDTLPWITTIAELKRQMLAICSKLLVCAALHDKLSKKVGACKNKADEAETREQLIEFILELETVLHEAVIEKQEGDLCAHIDLDEWRVEGHDFIDKRM